jgi:tRNA pseudouridine13 synthase
MPRDLDENQRNDLGGLNLPLPSSRLHVDPGDPRLAPMEVVLREEGIEREQLKLKGFREMFFSKGERAAWCFPDNLQSGAKPDDKHAGRKKLELAFELPRGSYATLIVKRITAG